MCNQVKMDRKQFAALMNMLEAIYCASMGWQSQSQAARSEALDYVGKERGKAKGWIPQKERA